MTRRKRLRERVADRKDGIKKTVDPGQPRTWHSYAGFGGSVLSIGALLLLGLEGLLVVDGKPMEFDRVLLLSVVFIAGRAVKAGADAVRF